MSEGNEIENEVQIRYICQNHGELASENRVMISHSDGVRWCYLCLKNLFNFHCGELKVIKVNVKSESVVIDNKREKFKDKFLSFKDKIIKVFA